MLQGNVLFSNELARRYGDQGIISTSLNPGNLSSNLYRHLSPIVVKLLVSIAMRRVPFLLTRARQNWTVLYPNSMGALTQLYAGTMGGKELNGKVKPYLKTPKRRTHDDPQYLIPWARVGKASRAGSDEALAKALWEWCEEQVANL